MKQPTRIGEAGSVGSTGLGRAGALSRRSRPFPARIAPEMRGALFPVNTDLHPSFSWGVRRIATNCRLVTGVGKFGSRDIDSTELDQWWRGPFNLYIFLVALLQSGSAKGCTMRCTRNDSQDKASSCSRVTLTPSIIIVRVLQACDADCFMCDFRRSTDSYRWSADDALRTAKSAARAGITHARLTGGEPLLHDNILGIVRNLAQESLRVSIITNGGALEEKIDALVTAGLDQIIVSLDGPDASHDKFRGTKGLFNAAVRGLRRADALNPRPRLRVNTVAGPHNYDRLPEVFDLLADLNVDDWSIIPLKLPGGPWLNQRTTHIEEAFEAFRTHIKGHEGPRLVGDAAAWIGRSPEERIGYLKGDRVMTPRTRCGVPERVRYYVPAEGRMHFCNCVPHRTGIEREKYDWDPDDEDAWGFTEEAAWLEENGPSTCRGCEPVNAAFGEGRIDLSVDPYGF